MTFELKAVKKKKKGELNILLLPWILFHLLFSYDQHCISKWQGTAGWGVALMCVNVLKLMIHMVQQEKVKGDNMPTELCICAHTCTCWRTATKHTSSALSADLAFFYIIE